MRQLELGCRGKGGENSFRVHLSLKGRNTSAAKGLLKKSVWQVPNQSLFSGKPTDFLLSCDITGMHQPQPAVTPEGQEKAVFVSKRQLADRYSVTVGCVNNWMRQGRIPYLRLSSQLVRFDLNAVDAALKRYEIRSQV